MFEIEADNRRVGIISRQPGSAAPSPQIMLGST
jgi:hypothetical protein